jgi:hypothetical protein
VDDDGDGHDSNVDAGCSGDGGCVMMIDRSDGSDDGGVGDADGNHGMVFVVVTMMSDDLFCVILVFRKLTVLGMEVRELRFLV